jgi:hypothetical protein
MSWGGGAADAVADGTSTRRPAHLRTGRGAGAANVRRVHRSPDQSTSTSFISVMNRSMSDGVTWWSCRVAHFAVIRFQ